MPQAKKPLLDYKIKAPAQALKADSSLLSLKLNYLNLRDFQ
ncbi:hypothetical protein [Facilibium subflavum]|nr:hypothetical protein [Facilibium subflavum]